MGVSSSSIDKYTSILRFGAVNTGWFDCTRATILPLDHETDTFSSVSLLYIPQPDQDAALPKMFYRPGQDDHGLAHDPFKVCLFFATHFLFQHLNIIRRRA